MDDHARRTQELQQRIREVAYLLWEAGGGMHGRSLEYWLAAEAEVIATQARSRARLDLPANPPHSPPDAGEAPAGCGD